MTKRTVPVVTSPVSSFRQVCAYLPLPDSPECVIINTRGECHAESLLSYSEFTFVWDEDKNAKNIKKHGISFAIAARVFEDELRLEYPDPEHSQDEERWRTIGLVHDVLTVVYCDRENRETGNTDIRIISARLATNLERNAYNNNIIGRY